MHVARSWPKGSKGKNKLTRCDALAVKYYNCSALISNVEVKNMDRRENSNEKLIFVLIANFFQNQKYRVFNGNLVEKHHGWPLCFSERF